MRFMGDLRNFYAQLAITQCKPENNQRVNMKLTTKKLYSFIFLIVPCFLVGCGGGSLLAAPDVSVTPAGDDTTEEPNDDVEVAAPDVAAAAPVDTSSTSTDASTATDEVVAESDESTVVSDDQTIADLDLLMSLDALPESAKAGSTIAVTYSVTNNTATDATVQAEIRIHDETTTETTAALVGHGAVYFHAKETNKFKKETVLESLGHDFQNSIFSSQTFQSFCTDNNPCTTISAEDVSVSAGETKSWTTSVILPATLNGTYHFVVRVMDATGAKFYARDFTTLVVTASDSTEESDTTTDDTTTDDTADEVEETTDDTSDDEVADEVEDDTADEVVEEDTTDEPQVDLTAGASLFSTSCAACHASDGTGASGPDLTTRIPSMSDADIEDQIRNGGGSMPAVGATFSDEEMVNIIAFLKTL